MQGYTSFWYGTKLYRIGYSVAYFEDHLHKRKEPPCLTFLKTFSTNQ